MLYKDCRGIFPYYSPTSLLTTGKFWLADPVGDSQRWARRTSVAASPHSQGKCPAETASYGLGPNP